MGVNTPRVARACGGAAAAIRPRQQCSCLRTGMASQNCKRLHRSASPRHTDAAKRACLQAGDCVLAGENGVPRNDRQACCGGPASCWPDQSCSNNLVDDRRECSKGRAAEAHALWPGAVREHGARGAAGVHAVVDVMLCAHLRRPRRAECCRRCHVSAHGRMVRVGVRRVAGIWNGHAEGSAGAAARQGTAACSSLLLLAANQARAATA